MFTHAHHQTMIAASPKTFAARLLDFVLAADAGYRARERLRQMSPHLLEDIGMAPRERQAEPQSYDPCLDF